MVRCGAGACERSHGDAAVDRGDGEVGGRLSLAHSLTALFLSLAAWRWATEAPLLQSHMKPVTWKPAVGPGLEEGGAGFGLAPPLPPVCWQP